MAYSLSQLKVYIDVVAVAACQCPIYQASLELLPLRRSRFDLLILSAIAAYCRHLLFWSSHAKAWRIVCGVVEEDE